DRLAVAVEIQVGGAAAAGVEQGDAGAVLDLVALLPEQAVVEALPADDHVAGDRIDAPRFLQLHAALLDVELARSGVRLRTPDDHRRVLEAGVRRPHEELHVARAGDGPRAGEG